jgi:cell division protein FtsB
MIGVHIDNTVHQIDINENDLQVDYFIHDHDSDTRYLIVKKDETNKVLLLKQIYNLYLNGKLVYVFKLKTKQYMHIGTLIENGNNGILTYIINKENNKRIVLLQNAYWDLRDENAELKTQILEKNEQIAQLRRELNAANSKVARLQQTVFPGVYLGKPL